jgi:hypothetical protein
MSGDAVVLVTISAKGRPVLHTHFAAFAAPQPLVHFHRSVRHRSTAMRAAATIPLPNSSSDVIDGDCAQDESDVRDSNAQLLTLQNANCLTERVEFGPNHARHIH